MSPHARNMPKGEPECVISWQLQLHGAFGKRKARCEASTNTAHSYPLPHHQWHP